MTFLINFSMMFIQTLPVSLIHLLLFLEGNLYILINLVFSSVSRKIFPYIIIMQPYLVIIFLSMISNHDFICSQNTPNTLHCFLKSWMFWLNGSMLKIIFVIMRRYINFQKGHSEGSDFVLLELFFFLS